MQPFLQVQVRLEDLHPIQQATFLSVSDSDFWTSLHTWCVNWRENDSKHQKHQSRALCHAWCGHISRSISLIIVKGYIGMLFEPLFRACMHSIVCYYSFISSYGGGRDTSKTTKIMPTNKQRAMFRATIGEAEARRRRLGRLGVVNTHPI